MSIIVYKIKFKLQSLYYRLFYLSVRLILLFNSNTLKVLSVDDTIKEVLTRGCSVSRYGDGEIRLINMEPIEFQPASAALALRLEEILASNVTNHIVCLPDVFNSLKPYKANIKYFWRRHLASFFSSWVKKTSPAKVYYSTFLTRPYIDFKDYNISKKWFDGIKSIWNNRDVVIIEGNKSRLGVGNDLFKDTRMLERIICPSVGAFSIYDKILSEAIKINKNKLVLIALGPTATVLAYDLHKHGYQAVDIGHIDIEYEWFLMKANHKVNIPHKHTNEAVGNNAPEEICDIVYSSQIISSLV